MSTLASPDPIARTIGALDALFQGRRDCYLSKQWKWVPEPLDTKVWRRHVMGGEMIGVAPLTSGTRGVAIRWACIDIDRDKSPGYAQELATTVCARSRHYGLDGHCELTKSRQVHVWFFWCEWVPAWQVRAILKMILSDCELEDKAVEKGNETTIHPRSDDIPPGGTGTGVYIPLFGPSVADGRQVFYDWQTGHVYDDQVGYIEGIQGGDAAYLASIVEVNELKPANVHKLPNQAPSTANKAAAGAMQAFSPLEFTNLCAKLPALRVLRENPGGATYQDWLAGIMHLVPFEDGRARAHELSSLDAQRYNAKSCDRQYDYACGLYASDEKQPGARVSQRLVEHWREGGRTDIIPIAGPYCVWNGCYAKREFTKTEPKQELTPTPYTNFTVTIVAEEWADDGAGGIERRIRLRGRLMQGTALDEKSIPAKEWNNMQTWLPMLWGHKPVLHAPGGLVLKVISLQHQDTPERRFYTHTGWTKSPDGAPVFLLGQGPVAGTADAIKSLEDNADVSVSDKLQQYNLPTAVTNEQVDEAYVWIERFLECAEKKATVPVMAAVFLGPLATIVNPQLALWLAGRSGSKKSSLVAAAMAVWGSTWTKDFKTGWRSSAYALLEQAFQAKDLPFVMDNYVPDARGKEQEKLSHIAYCIGDGASRDRLNANAALKSARPVRSVIISTGEDAPQGEGQSNRFYTIPMYERTVNGTLLEEVQEAGWAGRMAPAMRHYLDWLAARIIDPAWIRRVRERYYSLVKVGRRDGAVHMRLPEQQAWVQVGMDLLLSSHPRQKWISEAMPREIAKALTESSLERNVMSAEARLSFRFLSAVQYLFQVGSVRALGTDGKCPGKEPQLFGWRPAAAHLGDLLAPEDAPYVCKFPHGKEAIWIESDSSDTWWVCLEPKTVFFEIKETLRNACPITESMAGVRRSLISDGLMAATSEAEHYGVKVSLADGRRPRVWKLKGSEFLRVLGLVPDREAEAPIVRVGNGE